jgi:hypothetical protein
MFKKTMMPILLTLVAIILLAAVAYWYEQNWGLNGPFPSEHHH